MKYQSNVSNLNSSKAPYSYANFLNHYRWTHTATFLPKIPSSELSARRFVRKIESKLMFCSTPQKIKAFWVIEQAIQGNGYHIHILFNLTNNQALNGIVTWFKAKHGHCRLEKVNSFYIQRITNFLPKPNTDYGFIL